jgi:hypothetical protein
MAFRQRCQSRCLISHVLVQPHQRLTWLPKQQVVKWDSQRRAWFSRLWYDHRQPTIKSLKLTDGFLVMSDWGATHSGVASIQAGLDMNMPGGVGFSLGTDSEFGGNLTIAVSNGSVPIERVDDMVRRIMTPYYRLGQNKASYPGIDPSTPQAFWKRKFC